jgi:hypothetical protein
MRLFNQSCLFFLPDVAQESETETLLPREHTHTHARMHIHRPYNTHTHTISVLPSFILFFFFISFLYPSLQPFSHHNIDCNMPSTLIAIIGN